MWGRARVGLTLLLWHILSVRVRFSYGPLVDRTNFLRLPHTVKNSNVERWISYEQLLPCIRL